MVGITSYGAYIPIYRLSQQILASIWGETARRGERAVANFDEDSVTMAVEAAIDCLNGVDRRSVDRLYFASTTPVYREKQSASIIAAALDLRDDILTADFADSIGAAAGAIGAAIDAVAAGSAKKALVIASDRRQPPPDSAFESILGDGAAALLFTDSEHAVTIEDSYAITSEFIDVWRREEDTYIRTWEDRFIIEEGYSPNLKTAVSGLLRKTKLTANDFAKAAFYAPDPRSHAAMARALGLDAKIQVQDPMFTTMGNTGAAFVLMMLVAALEEAKAGDRILLGIYGDGASAYSLRVTEQIENIRDRRGIKRHLASKLMFPNYGKYLHFRNLMEWEAVRKDPTANDSSLNFIWRDRKQVIKCYGQKCRVCGHVQFPAQRRCMWCQAQDNFDDVRLADKKGTLFTFSMDERAVVPDLPNVISIIDLEGGGRFMSVMTDRVPQEVKVGMPVELTFRRIHEGGGFHNYFWKCRSIRC